jgi:uncharacterized protein YunC (DUF1805 family)
VVTVVPVAIDEHHFVGVEVKLPKTTLLSISCDSGYVMCGALDIELLRTQLSSRNILAARAVGVRTIDDLLNGSVETCTQSAEEIGIRRGMSICDALVIMKQSETFPQ